MEETFLFVTEVIGTVAAPQFPAYASLPHKTL